MVNEMSRPPNILDFLHIEAIIDNEIIDNEEHFLAFFHLSQS